jgi:replicative DNA helicase
VNNDDKQWIMMLFDDDADEDDDEDDSCSVIKASKNRSVMVGVCLGTRSMGTY